MLNRTGLAENPRKPCNKTEEMPFLWYNFVRLN